MVCFERCQFVASFGVQVSQPFFWLALLGMYYSIWNTLFAMWQFSSVHSLSLSSVTEDEVRLRSRFSTKQVRCISCLK